MAGDEDADDHDLQQHEQHLRLMQDFIVPSDILGGLRLQSESKKENTVTIDILTHYFLPLENDDSVMVILSRSFSELEMYTLQDSNKLLFFFADNCSLIGDREHFSRHVYKLHDQVQPGLASLFSVSGRIPCFDSDGVVKPLREWRSDCVRVCLTWSAVKTALKHGLIRGRKDLYHPSEGIDFIREAESVHQRILPLSILVCGQDPKDYVKAIISGAAQFLVQDQASKEPEHVGKDVPVSSVSHPRPHKGTPTCGQAAAHRHQLCSLDTKLPIIENIWGVLSYYFSQEKTGFRFLLYKNMRSLDLQSISEKRARLDTLGVEGSDKIAALIGPAPRVMSTDYLITELHAHFNRRAGRDGRDGVCVLLEMLTVMLMGPLVESEKVLGCNNIRTYSQKRKNLFRHLFDTMNTIQSAGHYNLGLDSPLSFVAHELGCPQSVLQLQRAYSWGASSRSVLRDSRARLVTRGHLDGVYWAASHPVIHMMDNFVHTLPLSLTIGGKVGSYVVVHFCHHVAASIYVGDDRTDAWQDFMRIDQAAKCWRCSGLQRPGAQDPGYVPDSEGAGLCKTCIVNPPSAVPDESLEAIIGSFRAMFPLRENKFLPCLYLPILMDKLGLHLKSLCRLTNAFAWIFTPAAALSDAYTLLRASLADRKTYPMERVEDHRMMDRCKVIDLSLSNTNTIEGLLRHITLWNSHPILGWLLRSTRVLTLADVKIYKALERLKYSSDVDIVALQRVMRPGLFGFLDVGLHAISKYSEEKTVVYKEILEKYFEKIIKHQGGQGHFFSKMRLSTRMILLSAAYQAYAGSTPDNAKCLNEAYNEFKTDEALGALMALHEWHIPLLIYYWQCFKLGRSEDVEVRREAFDVWFESLLPLMVVSMGQLGSQEYHKVLLQFQAKLHWLKEHCPEFFAVLRDNMALMLDSEPIELIHSWIVHNCKNINVEHSETDQVRGAFHGKTWTQAFKSQLAETLGESPAKGSKGPPTASGQFQAVRVSCVSMLRCYIAYLYVRIKVYSIMCTCTP